MKAQDRRKIYVSSLEAHVDALHAQLLGTQAVPRIFRTPREDTRRPIQDRSGELMFHFSVQDPEPLTRFRYRLRFSP
jgi:hypothetical protein